MSLVIDAFGAESGDAPEPPVAVHGDTRYTLLPGRLHVERGAKAHDLPLDDPDELAFLRLPAVDLDNGRPLRRAAFDMWSDHVRAAVAAGREFETTYHAPRPLVTGLTIMGAALVAWLCAALLWTWAFRPVPAVEVRATMLQSVAILVSVTVVVGICVLCVAALVRAWRCRRGSYAGVTSFGLRVQKGGRARALGDVAVADWHPFVRCTRIVLAEGGDVLWVPAEAGALRRLDLLLAALDDRLGATVRAAL